MFYITGINGMRYRLLAGPYDTAAEARADVERAQEAAATYHDGGFDLLEVEQIEGFNVPGRLNARGFSATA